MAGTVTFKWDKDAAVERMRVAANQTLGRVSQAAHQWWLVIVPVGKDTKHHKAGELRDSWFAFEVDTPYGVALVFGARAPYAIYVELGTGKMPPRAPVRMTAGEVFPFIEPFLREELAR